MGEPNYGREAFLLRTRGLLIPLLLPHYWGLGDGELGGLLGFLYSL